MSTGTGTTTTATSDATDPLLPVPVPVQQLEEAFEDEIPSTILPDDQQVAKPAPNQGSVPPSLRLSKHLQYHRERLLQIPLQEIQFWNKNNNNNNSPEELRPNTESNSKDPLLVTTSDDGSTLGQVLEAQSAKVALAAAASTAATDTDTNMQPPTVVSVVFCVRRPGCSACREHGQALVELAASQTPPNQLLSIWGIVKETGVDDEGLVEFSSRYFGNFPLYKDEKWLIYKAMGSRRISCWDLMVGIAKSYSRLKSKQIDTNLIGEGWLYGGVLVFDANHQLVYALEETFGDDLNIEELRMAIEEARKIK